MPKYLSAALVLARGGFGKNKHGAILVNNGKVVAIGTNVRKGVGAEYSENSWRGSHIHAEAVVISAAGHRAKGGTLYVARSNQSGSPRPSRPCERCQGAIERAGIRRVVHT